MPESRSAQWWLIGLAVLTLMVAVYAAVIKPVEVTNERLAEAVIVSDKRISELEIKVAVLEDRVKR